MDVIIPILNLVCVLFDPAIPTSSFNFIQLFLYLYILMYVVQSESHMERSKINAIST